jgi:nucleoside-diphosphate-sugar epimerase
MKKLVDTIGVVTGRQPKTKVLPHLRDDIYPLVADISKIKSIGYTSKVSLIDGIRQLTKALGKHPELPGCETIFKKGQKGEAIQ